MSISNTGMNRRPTHPGEMLREDFLPDYELTVAGLAEAVGVSRQSINELLRERRAVSPDMALRLARLFGNTPRVLSRSAQRNQGDAVRRYILLLKVLPIDATRDCA
jgi:addiction module HigA family antidote